MRIDDKQQNTVSLLLIYAFFQTYILFLSFYLNTNVSLCYYCFSSSIFSFLSVNPFDKLYFRGRGEISDFLGI